MAEFDPAPPDDALTREQEVWQETTNTRERIRAVVMGLQEPTSAATIAERAQCSVNAARTHLEEFVDIGIIRKREHSAGAQYVRNEAYVHWRRANELATSHTIEELLEELATFEARDEQYQEQFDAATPSDVDIPTEATHAELEAQLETLSEWATVREAIDRHKEAIRIARRSDSRLTA
jgi:predicted ArsR family transcriptional regulator